MQLIRLTIAIIAVLFRLQEIDCKYIEGELKTSDNWAFLTRFCFLSEEGEFEYSIQFNEENGYPNLLLYYDTDEQWPSVYKTNKTCDQKEKILKMKQNQIINLTMLHPHYMEISGCRVAPVSTTITTTTTTTTTTPIPTHTVKVPTRATTLSSSSFIIEFFNTSETSTSETDLNVTKAPIVKRHLYYSDSVQKNRLIICRHARRFQSSRERWWFIAISNCNSTNGIHIKYKMLMTNGLANDYWHNHFSADQFYILPILLAYSVGYSLLILAILICSVELKSRQLLHATYKLFVLSVIIQFFGIILETAAYLKYAVNGIGVPTAKTFGSMMMGCSETCFLLMLLLLAKGYTVTRGRLRLGSSVKLTIFMCVYSVTYVTIFVYEARVFDPGEVLYLYESPAGYALIVLRIIAWVMFVYSTVFTLKHYPEKSIFYYPFNVCGTLWFVAGPAFIISANTYIDKWVRESVVCAVLLLISFGGHLMFLMLTLPSMANKNFPYHVRTSQIGIMEVTGTAGVSTIERFGHHVYAPTEDVPEERIIIPLTRRTEQLCNNSHEYNSNNYRKNFNMQNGFDIPEEVATMENMKMQNVLNWSFAKNCSAFDVNRPSLSKPQSPASPSTPPPVSPTSSTSHQTNYDEENDPKVDDSLHNNHELVKDVPVELFTVSKLISRKETNG
ncbi:hypothetical protein FQA39_LY11692 [Lamprigera yunnana]|nr:hypothetical protein FQA39_LY11692 [Lamprigera yunnana]